MSFAISFYIEKDSLVASLMALDGFINAPKIELTEGLGRLIQGQTRRRLVDEKTAPNGEEWKPNKAGTSILYASGALMRSIDYAATSDYVAVGSGLNYARIHQFGGKIEPKNAKSLRFIGVGGGAVFAKMVQMPARPYIGLSADNAEEIVHTAEAWLARFADPLPRAEPVGNWGSQSVPAAEPVGNW